MMMDYFVANSALTPAPTGIQSTAGAVPVKNDKGELSMKKVKVHRYVSGKRPEYAPTASSDEESEEDDFLERRGRAVDYDESVTEPRSVIDACPEVNEKVEEREKDDPRLRRLTRLERERQEERQQQQKEEDDNDDNDDDIEEIRERRRRVEEAEVLIADAEDDEDTTPLRERIKLDSSESSDEEELSESEIERRRDAVRKKALQRKEAEEELIKAEEDEAEEKSGESSESSSEYEEYTDSEEEMGPRLKPVFVRKSDRVTVLEKAKEAEKKKLLAMEAEKLAEQRKKASKKLVEECVRQEQQVRSSMYENEGHINDVVTDDENDELVYEAWKLRELKRNKRDREERETREKERAEIERLRNMTEEERRAEARLNPKTVTNKAAKGKYKFLQKYYHRGAFYLDKDDHIYKRDFSGATLEDHFDKTVLPKVMQVKNFGRSGRTKYTHLVDQDTTQFDSPWISETAHNLKFYNNQAAGVKQIFDKPTLRKKKAADN